jgi:hypothetical protein
MRVSPEHDWLIKGIKSELDWFTCKYPRPLLGFLRGKVSDRKLRLFAGACCRRVHHLSTQDVLVQVIGVSERFADGQATEHDLNSSTLAAGAAVSKLRSGGIMTEMGAAEAASGLTKRCFTVDDAIQLSYSVATANWARVDLETEDGSQTLILRDIVGNPFRLVSILPAWRSEPVVGLARSTYEEQAFNQLPILADALEEAGCDSTDILQHCRGDGPHVLGCWVLDMLLGRE